MLKEILDALPSAVFVVDKDVHIQEYNNLATQFITAAKNAVFQQRAGDILHCIHSSAILGGCGRASACQSCVIRNSVTDALQANCIIRRRTKIQLLSPQKSTIFHAVVTVSPFCLEEISYALLMLEDLNELAKLYRRLLVCRGCGKLLDGDNMYNSPDSSLSNNWNIDCSYSYCIDCFSKEMYGVGELETR